MSEETSEKDNSTPAPNFEAITEKIREIIKENNVDDLSSRRVRNLLEENFGVDLVDRKKEIDNILMKEIESAAEAQEKEGKDEGDSSFEQKQEPDAKKEATRSQKKDAEGEGDKSESESDSSEEFEDGIEEAEEVPKKKRKLEPGTSNDQGEELNDEEMALKLQREERRYSTRKGRESPKPEKKPKKQRRGKICYLSDELAAIVGENELSRAEVIKKMWAQIKERDLYDPKNRQFIICDEQFETVFNKKRVKAFGMMKFLKKHIKERHLVSS